jgi:hypothetical protein
VSHRVKLVDDADEAGRSTATLLASLAARLGTLHVISGAQAIGSLTAGFAELGRQVSQTPEGARVRDALARGRAGTNGEAIWASLRIGEWASAHAPAPVLDQLRNDLALMLADDLEQTLELMPIPPEPAGARGAQDVPPAAFLDFAVGYWAFSVEVVRGIEALAAPHLGPASAVRDGTPPEADGPLLR